MEKRTILKINITSYIGSISAEHYYGSISRMESDEDLYVIAKNIRVLDFKSEADNKLYRVLGAEEAVYLNKKDGSKRGRWHEGDSTERFNEVNELKLHVFKTYPNCDVVFLRHDYLESIDMDVHQMIKSDSLDKTGKKIKIVKFGGFNPTVFANLINGSEHEIIETPERYKYEELMEGYWVMGIGEPVLILLEECKLIN